MTALVMCDAARNVNAFFCGEAVDTALVVCAQRSDCGEDRARFDGLANPEVSGHYVDSARARKML